jgi:lipoyl(octanoyl) transferase
LEEIAAMTICRTIDLGTIGYGEAAVLQERLVAARKLGAAPDLLLLCEHPHVITLGRNGKRENLLASEDLLRCRGVEFHHSNRGGDITYHGPGQIVGYPILDLNGIRRDVVWYVRQLEECMIRATSSFGIQAFRVPGRTGVWVRATEGGDGARTILEDRSGVRPDAGVGTESSDSPAAILEKLAAIGVHISRWVTSHGFAYNVSTDLRFFDLITPCGIAGCRATSLEKLLGIPVARADAIAHLTVAFGEVFGLDLEPVHDAELNGWLTGEETPVGVRDPEAV